MLPRAVSLAYMLCLVMGASLAFLMLLAFDSLGILGPSAQVHITQVGSSVNVQEVAEILMEFATRSGVDVAKPTLNFSDPNGPTELFIAVGAGSGPVSDWLSEGRYPDFGGGRVTEVSPISAWRSGDPSGYYWIFGSREQADTLLAALARIGLHGSSAPYPGLQALPGMVAHTASASTLTLTVLLVIALTGGGVGANAKTIGVQRLHGSTAIQIVARDVRQLGGLLGMTLAVSSGMSIAGLWIYNDLRQLAHFAVLAVGLTGAFLAVTLTTHLVAVIVLSRTPPLLALKGELPSSIAIGSIWLLRGATILLATSLTTSAVQGMLLLQQQEAGAPTWQRVSGAAFLTLTPASSTAGPGLDAHLGAAIRQADARGEVIVTVPFRDRGGIGDLLIVNEAFLDTQVIRDSEGHRVGRSLDDTVRLLGDSSAPAVLSKIGAWIEFERRARTTPDPEIQVIPTAAGQGVFTLIGKPEQQLPIWHHGPILVLPNGSDVLSDASLVAYATTGQAFLLSPASFLRDAAGTDFEPYLSAMEPVVTAAAHHREALAAEQTQRMFNVAGTQAVLLMSSMGASVVYGRRFAQALFVKHAHGWTFLRSNRSFLVGELALAHCLAVWIGVSSARAESDATSPMTTDDLPPLEPVIGSAIVTVAFSIAVMVLRAVLRRVTATAAAAA